MDPQERYNSFLAYLEAPDSLTPEQSREVETRIDEFQPYQSEYLPMVFPGGLHWFYKEDRVMCVQIMKSLFFGGELKATSSKSSTGWKTIKLQNPDYFILDLIYSVKNNADHLPGIIEISKVADNRSESIYAINKLKNIEIELLSMSNILNPVDIDKLKKSIVDIIDNIYSNSDILSRDYKRSIRKEYKQFSIIQHLYVIYKYYVPTLGKEALCKRIEETLSISFLHKNYNFSMIKKTLQRCNLI
jgi:hypothetical protein